MAKKKNKRLDDHKGPKVTEYGKIKISQILDEFLLSNDEVYVFYSNMSNLERAVVHVACRKLGMKSRSLGLGQQRRVHVYKLKKKAGDEKSSKNKAGDKKSKNITNLTFSDETKEVLNSLFTRYPPDDGETHKEIVGKHSLEANKRNYTGDNIFHRPNMNKEKVLKKMESLASRMERAENLKKISAERSRLPIASYRDIITSTVESNQVVLISGETGCGKTTQVPQFLLDYMWGKGEACKIICSQPRRISATSVAERITHERGENVGDDIGYKIRLESKGGRHSSIVFCTNGILLRVLVSKGIAKSEMGALKEEVKHELSHITHIIVDEIHERDRYSDFMLAIIRDMLPAIPHLRLILMSATIDAEQFSRYFGGCPIIRVPGFTYPVQSFYLENVISVTKSSHHNHHGNTGFGVPTTEHELTEEDRIALDKAIDSAWSNDECDFLIDLVSSGASQVLNYQHSSSGLSPLMVFSGKGEVSNVCTLLTLGADCQLRDKDELTALDWADRQEQRESAEVIRTHLESVDSISMENQQLLNKYLSVINPEQIDVVLIEQLVWKICLDSQQGAILVFLPGWDDINKTRERLLKNQFFKDGSKFLILSLHSMVPAVDQKKVFKRPPRGCRKIILSTNIAETAITIDDVVYVIDSGRMKEKNYDPYNNVSTLQSSWVSKASAKQREGRAGRCQPGICYHLYTKDRAASLPEFQIPEIKRIPVDELCLQVKLLDPDNNIDEFLRKTMDPPVSEATRNAVKVLQDIGALSSEENLTALGEKLGSLPVHPLTGRMLLFAILMNCLDPALTLACASEYKDPFTLPMLPNQRSKADYAKQELSSLYGGHSDQLAVVAAFDCWNIATIKGEGKNFCSEFLISSGTMRMIKSMRKQLLSELSRLGFISQDISSCSLNARDPGILHAVLVSSLYPRVGKLYQRRKNQTGVKIYTGDNVRLVPHSVNSKLQLKENGDPPLLIYDDITRGDWGINIRNCTIVGPLPLIMFATDIAVALSENNKGGNADGSDLNIIDIDDNSSRDKGDGGDLDMIDIDDSSSGKQEGKIMASPGNSVTVVVDRWLHFGLTALEIAQIYCLKERLSAAILFKVTHPREVLPPVLGASMYALAWVLSYDGLSQISLPSELVDSSNGIKGSESGQRLKILLTSLTSPSTHDPPFPSQNRPPQQHETKPLPPEEKPQIQQEEQKCLPLEENPQIQQDEQKCLPQKGQPRVGKRRRVRKKLAQPEEPSPQVQPQQEHPSTHEPPVLSQNLPPQQHQTKPPSPEEKPQIQQEEQKCLPLEEKPQIQQEEQKCLPLEEKPQIQQEQKCLSPEEKPQVRIKRRGRKKPSRPAEPSAPVQPQQEQLSTHEPPVLSQNLPLQQHETKLPSPEEKPQIQQEEQKCLPLEEKPQIHLSTHEPPVLSQNLPLQQHETKLPSPEEKPQIQQEEQKCLPLEEKSQIQQEEQKCLSPEEKPQVRIKRRGRKKPSRPAEPSAPVRPQQEQLSTHEPPVLSQNLPLQQHEMKLLSPEEKPQIQPEEQKCLPPEEKPQLQQEEQKCLTPEEKPQLQHEEQKCLPPEEKRQIQQEEQKCLPEKEQPQVEKRRLLQPQQEQPTSTHEPPVPSQNHPPQQHEAKPPPPPDEEPQIQQEQQKCLPQQEQPRIGRRCRSRKKKPPQLEEPSPQPEHEQPVPCINGDSHWPFGRRGDSLKRPRDEM